MQFRDVLEITVQGGKGGDGAMSFLRLKYIEKGGPDGGHGGAGGSVYLESAEGITSLDALQNRRTYKAGTGMQGEGRDRAGEAGADLTLTVPVGTIATDLDTGDIVADLIEDGQRALVAAGGSGGRGNASFANATRQAPRFAERGTPGDRRRLQLELRTIADAGLVGYPNAGKSSLLAALSNARPKIADYPFTTLSPNLGVVEREGQGGPERLTVADIPGIVEDAHLGKGLGLEFLRHIARTRLLVYVLDVADGPLETLEALRRELEAYDPGLLDRPALVLLNKVDLLDDADVAAAEASLTRFGLPVLTGSASERRGMDDLVRALFELLPPKPTLVPRDRGPARVVADPVRVERDASGSGWVVRGREIEAVVDRFDASNAEAVAYLQHHFGAMGVNTLLRRAGAKTGDDVTIGAATFEYFDEQAEEARQRREEREEARERVRAERRYLESEAPGEADVADDAAGVGDDDAADGEAAGDDAGAAETARSAESAEGPGGTG